MLLIVIIMPSFIVLNTQIIVKLICWYVRSRYIVSLYSLMSSRQDNIIKKIALYVCKLVDRFEQGHKYSHVMTQLSLRKDNYP